MPAMTRMDFNLARQNGARDMLPGIPAPSIRHRHGTPSGPWPFPDPDDEIDQEQLAISGSLIPARACDHLDPAKCKDCWSGYPQSLFPNWTRGQQKKSRISEIIDWPMDPHDCIIHYVDIAKDGIFTATGNFDVGDAIKDAHWEFMRQPRPKDTRLRAMFIERLAGPVLQMLGTNYNIEPFFFSSSLGWIPSRYQGAVQPNEGDHIMITLTFIRTMYKPTMPNSLASSSTSTISQPRYMEQVIDTQAPLFMRSSDCILLPDLLALYMVRSSTSNTIISYHPGPDHATAHALHARLNTAGNSGHWNTIFANNDDPTFVILILLWYALYAWDEAFEVLYKHIGWLESQVMEIYVVEASVKQEHDVIQAYILHYASLLDDFRKAVVFVLNSPNPALNDPARYSAEARERSHGLMRTECEYLLKEIERLEKSRAMQDERLKNLAEFGIISRKSMYNRYGQELVEATVGGSVAKKQLSYITMIFLPASFVATVFGMKVEAFIPGTRGTLSQYFATAIPLTVVTIWVIVAFQFHPISDHSLVRRTVWRLGWPIVLAMYLAEPWKIQQRNLIPGRRRNRLPLPQLPTVQPSTLSQTTPITTTSTTTLSLSNMLKWCRSIGTITPSIATTATPAILPTAATPTPAPVAVYPPTNPVRPTTNNGHYIRLVPHQDSRRSLRFDPIYLKEGDPPLRIGRFTDRSGLGLAAVNVVDSNKLTFKSKVVSRAHAEIWVESGERVFIKDTKSLGGTFLNQVRLSAANTESSPYQLKNGDILQLGVDYQGGAEDIYKSVKIQIEVGRKQEADIGEIRAVD